TAGGEEILPALDGHGPADRSFDPKRLRQALAKFRQLPPERRQPRPEDLPALWRGAGYPEPPPGGVVLKLHGRAFGLSATGRVYPYPHFGGGPLLDYFWLTGSEAMALVPPNPAAGDSV